MSATVGCYVILSVWKNLSGAQYLKQWFSPTGQSGEDPLPVMGARHRCWHDTSWSAPHTSGVSVASLPMPDFWRGHPSGVYQADWDHRVYKGDDERSGCNVFIFYHHGKSISIIFANHLSCVTFYHVFRESSQRVTLGVWDSLGIWLFVLDL